MEGQPPQDGLQPPLRHAAPRRACKPKGQFWAPTPAHPRPQHVGSGGRQPALRMGGRGGGRAPELRRPSQRRKASPLEMPSHHPHSAQGRLARVHAVGPVLGPHAHTYRTREPRVVKPWPPAPRDGRPARDSACHLTPLTRVEGQPPRDGLRQPPRHAAPGRACKPKGPCWTPTPAHLRPQHVGSGPPQPAQMTGSLGRESA